MERITYQQIREFIDPKAFSIPRADSTAAADNRRLATKTVSQTRNLLAGASQRLRDLAYNLETMRELAQKGAKGRLTDRAYDDVVGRLRSLTAGFDQAVDATRFQGKGVFDGRELRLDNGAGFLSFQAANLSADGEGGLDLIRRVEGAKVTIGYDPATLIRNDASGLTGLEVTNASGVPPAEGRTELKDGKYQLEMKYAGPDSELILRDANGLTVSTKKGVDLSGTSKELVRMDVGLELEIDKERLLGSFDKYPYEILGPTSLYTDLAYQRVSFHELQDGQEAKPRAAEVDFLYQPKRRYGDGSLNILEAEPDGLGELKRGLSAGTYTLDVRYGGAQSTIELRDSRGIMVTRLRDVDLRDDKNVVDLGVGLRVTIENRNIAGGAEPRQRAVLSYTPARTGEERDVDFKGLLSNIEAALSTVYEQQDLFQQAQDQVDQIRQWQQGSGGTSSMVSSLLGSAGGNSLLNLFGKTGASAQSRVSAQQLFGTLNGQNSQSGLTPSILNYIR